jgi:hypothetical protein
MLCSPDPTIRGNAVQVLVKLSNEQAREVVDILFQMLEEHISPQATRSIIQYVFFFFRDPPQDGNFFEIFFGTGKWAYL